MIPVHLLQKKKKKKKAFKKSIYLNSIPRFSGVQIRGWPSQKHLFHQGHQVESPPSRPFSPLRGQQAQEWGWEGGAELAPSPPHSCCPFFLSAIQTVHTAKQGAEGQSQGHCAFRMGKEASAREW